MRTVDSLDELKELAGSELGLTEWMIVSQERINQFAAATGDHQWIHLDSERARRESPYGTTIAHGFLTLAFISDFVRQSVEIRGLKMTINYGLNRVRFPSAVRADSRVRGRVTLQSVKGLPEGVEATYVVSVESEGSGKPACVAEWVVRYYA